MRSVDLTSQCSAWWLLKGKEKKTTKIIRSPFQVLNINCFWVLLGSSPGKCLGSRPHVPPGCFKTGAKQYTLSYLRKKLRGLMLPRSWGEKSPLFWSRQTIYRVSGFLIRSGNQTNSLIGKSSFGPQVGLLLKCQRLTSSILGNRNCLKGISFSFCVTQPQMTQF